MAGKYALTEAKIAKWTKAGRGKGTGASYKPWITIQDLSSKGRVTRMCGATTGGRVAHFLSDLEYALALQCDWEPAVVDMREQFPIPREDTLAIADDLGVRHPRDGDVPIVMTTDLLLDLERPSGRILSAVSVKYADDLEDERTVEKLMIERRYWLGRGVRWTLMTEREIVKDAAETYRRLRQCRHFEGCDAPPVGDWSDIADAVEAGFLRARDASVAAMCRRLEEAAGWRSGDALAAVWHLAANRRLLFDVEAGVDPRGPIAQFAVPTADRRPLEVAA